MGKEASKDAGKSKGKKLKSSEKEAAPEMAAGEQPAQTRGDDTGDTAVETSVAKPDEHMARAVSAAAQTPMPADNLTGADPADGERADTETPTAEAPEQVQAAEAAQAPAAPEDPWARPITRLQTTERPNDDAFAANLEGRQVVSPLQGFGQLWQRTYRVRLTGLQVTPEEVMAEWKTNFPLFQPEGNRFYPTSAGVKPGHMVYIDSNLIQGPGMSQMTEVASGVMVIYSDAVSFTVMTPEGFPVSGWNTFSAHEEDGAVVAQVQGLERAADPIYEFGYRFLGGERKQDRTWIHVLRSLAAHFGIRAEVQSSKTLVDHNLQWNYAGNVWHNAAIRTLIFRMTNPVRKLVKAANGRSS